MRELDFATFKVKPPISEGALYAAIRSKIIAPNDNGKTYTLKHLLNTPDGDTLIAIEEDASKVLVTISDGKNSVDIVMSPEEIMLIKALGEIEFNGSAAKVRKITYRLSGSFEDMESKSVFIKVE